MNRPLIDHRDVMIQLAQREGWRRGAELGLGRGHLFRRWMAECADLFLIGVDLCKKASWRDALLTCVATHRDRCVLHAMSTVDAASLVPDASLDFVFIDAGHSRQAVTQDIARWWPKVKTGGWVGGHDYHPRHPGVIAAVHARFGAGVAMLPHAIWWVPR